VQLIRLAVCAVAALLPVSAVAEEVMVPVDLGIGPLAQWFTGPIGRNQMAHFGLKFSLAAVLDKEFIHKHIHRVPAKYRGMASRMDEVRYRPSIFIPDALWISPKVQDVGMYGATWRPFSLALPIVRRQSNVDLTAGVLVTAAYLHGAKQVLPNGDLVFVRLGLDVGIEWEIPVIEDAFLVSLGWLSQFYLPQKLAGPFGEVGGFDDGSVWHVGQVFVQGHWRLPYTTQL
jgi:hypothetical protein